MLVPVLPEAKFKAKVPSIWGNQAEVPVSVRHQKFLRSFWCLIFLPKNRKERKHGQRNMDAEASGGIKKAPWR